MLSVYFFGALFLAVFYLPVYLPFLLSFALKAPEWRRLKWCLRIAALLCLSLAIIPPPGLRHDFGNDVPGNIAGARHNFPIELAWFWGGGLLCTLVMVTIGVAFRHRCNSNPQLNH